MTNEELDRWIAENVIGDKDLWLRFTTFIDQAFIVVEKMRDRGYDLYLSNSQYKGRYTASFGDMHPMVADTPSMAICLAARKALEDK